MGLKCDKLPANYERNTNSRSLPVDAGDDCEEAKLNIACKRWLGSVPRKYASLTVHSTYTVHSVPTAVDRVGLKYMHVPIINSLCLNYSLLDCKANIAV